MSLSTSGRRLIEFEVGAKGDFKNSKNVCAITAHPICEMLTPLLTALQFQRFVAFGIDQRDSRETRVKCNRNFG